MSVKKVFLTIGTVCLAALLLGPIPARAWCIYNHTDIPILFWAENVKKGRLSPKSFDCLPGGMFKIGGARWISVSEIQFPHSQTSAFYHIPYQIPKNGDAVIYGGPAMRDMMARVFDHNQRELWIGRLQGPFSEVKQP